MSIKIVGKTKAVERIETGLYTFDRAFTNQDGDIGMPLGVGLEIYGKTGTGKTTIAFSLAGFIATLLETNIVLADLEGFDPEFMETILESTGFDGTLVYLQEKDDETELDSLVAHMRKKEFGVGILDSIGAISPIAEQEGDLGNRNMGQRAFLMAQFSRKMLKILRDNPHKTLISTNHAYPQIGGRGTVTPGGVVKNFINTVIIQVGRKFLKGKYEEFPDGSYIIEGKVIKNRWGLKNKIFNLFVLGGVGIHPGLTAMYDGKMLKLVTQQKMIKIGDTSFGYLKDLTIKAREGDTAFFDPFFEILKNHDLHTTPEEEVQEETVTDLGNGFGEMEETRDAEE